MNLFTTGNPKIMKGEIMMELQSGDEVFWTDPDDEGMSSGYYFIDSILTEDGTYNSERDFDDTIIVIHNESGSHAEVYVNELEIV